VGRVLWVFIVVLIAILCALFAARQTRIDEPHALGLDFGDSPELVEYTLRAIAKRAEREGICNLNIYLETRNEECRRIATRLCEYIPLYLHLGAHTAVPAVQIAGFAGINMVQQMRFKSLVH
jgi:hypothetical protein